MCHLVKKIFGTVFITTVLIAGLLSIIQPRIIIADGKDLDNQWPMLGFDAMRTGRSPYVGAQTNNVKWKIDTIPNSFSSPAISQDGTIYYAESTTGAIYALNPEGTIKWQYLIGDTSIYGIESSPAIGQDGTIYIGSTENNMNILDSHIYALNPDGSLKWRYLTAGLVHSSPVVASDGTVIVGSNDGYLYALNPKGTLKWKSKFDNIGGGSTSPAIGPDGTIYYSKYPSLYAVDPENGNANWSFKLDSLAHSPAVGDDGTIYIGANDNYLYAINPDGTQKWQFAANVSYYSLHHYSSSIGLDGTIYFGSTDGYVYAVNPDGSQKWVTLVEPSSSSCHSKPTIGADGIIYIGCGVEIIALNPDGSERWSHNLKVSVQTSPAISADGTVYIGGIGLWAFGDTSTPQPPPTFNNWVYLPLITR